MKQDPEEMKRLVVKVQSWLHRVHWRKAQYGVLSCIKRRISIVITSPHKLSIDFSQEQDPLPTAQSSRDPECSTRAFSEKETWAEVRGARVASNQ